MNNKTYTQTAFIPFKKDISQERQEFMSHNWKRIEICFDSSKMTLEEYEAELKKQLEEKIEMVEKAMDKANKLTWKQIYSNKVPLMNNEELLREYRNLLMDMPVKGVVSDNSQWRLQKVEVELKERLINCGFLPPF